MTPLERTKLIEQLDLSFLAMPRWAKIACKHAMAAPKNNPITGLPFKTFREVLEVAADETLLTLRDDFADNGDLIPLAVD